MSEELMKIADNANLIVNGFAFTVKNFYQDKYMECSLLSDTGFYGDK